MPEDGGDGAGREIGEGAIEGVLDGVDGFEDGEDFVGGVGVERAVRMGRKPWRF